VVTAGMRLSAGTRRGRNAGSGGVLCSGVTLDVWAPLSAAQRPVVVLLHGCCASKEDLGQLAEGYRAGVANAGGAVPAGLCGPRCLSLISVPRARDVHPS
jgi:hypothetical protein